MKASLFKSNENLTKADNSRRNFQKLKNKSGKHKTSTFYISDEKANEIDLVENNALLKKNLQKMYNLDDRLFCTVCDHLLDKPIQTDCGCRMCTKCFDAITDSGNQYCPSKFKDCINIKMKIKFIDRAIEKEMKDIQIECVNEECKTILSLFNLYNHLENCEFSLINCSSCFTKVLKQNRIAHENNHCINRMYTCKDCLSDMTFIEYNLDHHDVSNLSMLCENYTAKCPYKCSPDDIANIKLHLKIHHKSSSENNSYLQKSNEIQINNDIIDRLHQKCQILEKSNFLINSEPIEQNIIKEKFQDRLENLKYEFKIIKTEFENLMSTECDELNVNSFFIWKIKSFNMIRNDSKFGKCHSFLSKPFYTNQIGYKLFFKIYPNGDGIGKGSHLSVYIAIGKGKYDSLLKWPFSNKFTIKLLNQNGGKNYSEDFKPNDRSQCYLRPVNEINSAFGNPTYIDFKRLCENDNYLKDDVIFIKFEFSK